MPISVGIPSYRYLLMKYVIRFTFISACWTTIVFSVLFLFFSFCALSFNIAEWSNTLGRFMMFLVSLFFGFVVATAAELIENDEAKSKQDNEDSDRDRHSHATY